MAITLGTNIPSLNTRNNLNRVTSSLTNIFERLTTGSKINKAGDDAAGLVISQNMEAYIRSSKQAQKNIQTAQSFLDVAEDGMIAISDHFQRINDLLTNMANDSNDKDSRIAAIEEIKERLKEIDRLAETTNFNGRKMLNGEEKSIYIQMGPDDTDDSVIDIAPALSDCHVKVFKAELPGILDPNNDAAGTFDPSNANCREYMQTIQDAIGVIAGKRGLLGAYENRMQSSYDSLTTRIESLENAKTVYTDTDIAEEATNLIQKQILQQVNVSVLANANTSQQLALSLLGG